MIISNRNTLKKDERLHSKKLIDRLFNKKDQLKDKSYPLMLVSKQVTLDTFTPNVQVLIVVPKKKIKKAVDRNIVRRRLKEAYRQNKHKLNNALALNKKKLTIAFIYLENKPLDYQTLEKKIIVLLDRLTNKIESSS